MPGKAAKVTITERQQVILEELNRSRSESQMISQRAGIILLAFAGLLNEEIAGEVGLHRKQVGLWRRRWQECWEALTLLECTEPRRLRTQRELQDEVVKRGIVEDISESRIGHFLREAALQPHRRKMWLNTKEKDPEQFQEQVETVCETYQSAPERHEQNGTHTVSCDEMTGIQALERIAPDKPVCPGQIAREEFEYTRHGTTTLIGNFDVVTGEMIACTIGPTRTEDDFVRHIEQTVASDPNGEWIFIADTLNIHWSASLVEWIAQHCEPDRPLGKKGEVGNPPKPSESSSVSV